MKFRLRHPKPPKLVENDVERQLLDYLRVRRYRVERLHTGRFKSLDSARFITGHPIGTPDYVVTHPEYPAFYLEVKRPGGAATPEQNKRHLELRLCGFKVVTACSIESLSGWLIQNHARNDL